MMSIANSAAFAACSACSALSISSSIAGCKAATVARRVVPAMGRPLALRRAA